jgi:beta-catenin-like protein 1
MSLGASGCYGIKGADCAPGVLGLVYLPQQEEAAVLVDALVEQGALGLLVHRLGAFDEKVAEEASAVYNILAIIENVVEVKPELAETVFEKTKVGRMWLEGPVWMQVLLR